MGQARLFGVEDGGRVRELAPKRHVVEKRGPGLDPTTGVSADNVVQVPQLKGTGWAYLKWTLCLIMWAPALWTTQKSSLSFNPAKVIKALIDATRPSSWYAYSQLHSLIAYRFG